MTEQSATTKELFDRWREAVRALDDHVADSAGWKAARFLADQAWNDYEHQRDEERGTSRMLDFPAAPLDDG